MNKFNLGTKNSLNGSVNKIGMSYNLNGQNVNSITNNNLMVTDLEVYRVLGQNTKYCIYTLYLKYMYAGSHLVPNDQFFVNIKSSSIVCSNINFKKEELKLSF